jgi:hypothetical protein
MMMATTSLNRRHAELVSASIPRSGTTASADGWTLKQVQGDASRGHMLADTTAVLGAMDIVFGECDR